VSEADRLSATIQTDQEESEIFIRSQEVRDLVALVQQYCASGVQRLRQIGVDGG
jgi:hypothetical protein